MPNTDIETAEVARRYARRLALSEDERYSVLKPEVLLSAQERQRALIKILRQHANVPLDQLRVLEIGCGRGTNLLELIGLGFNPENLTANELLPERVAVAKRNLPPGCTMLPGDASMLDFQNQSFDIVYQSTVFTSILDENFRQQLAARMWSWLRPGGGILWYDFVYDNPRNRDVRGIPIKRIRGLFSGAEIDVRRVTLAPPLSRVICRVHPFGYSLLTAIPWLRTHVLCWIGKGKDVR